MDNTTRIICAPWIVPIRPRGTVLSKHALIIKKSRIADIIPQEKIEELHPDCEPLQLTRHILLPGFINAHTHSALSLVRHITRDRIPIDDRRWPWLHKGITPAMVESATMVAALRMLSGGVTCCGDTYYFPESLARAYTESGMRACVGLFIGDGVNPQTPHVSDCLSAGLAVHDKYKYDSHITFAFAAHAPYLLSDNTLVRVRTYADELNMRLHIHLQETKWEIEESVLRHGARPLQRLEKLGGITPALTAIHMEHYTAGEIKLLKQHQCAVVRCPNSSALFNRQGQSPRAFGRTKVREAGATGVALGSHAGIPHCSFDLFDEIKSVARPLAEVGGPSADDLLDMVTINGAHALGLQDTVGSLEKGKIADVVALDYADRHALLSGDDVTGFVTRAANASNVTHVWVGGRHVIRDSKSTLISETDAEERLRQKLSEVAR